MAQPGWYPDPGGQPRMFRYWDGSSWTQQLSAKPPGQPPGDRGGRTGPIVLGIVALIVLALTALLLPQLVGGGTPTPSSTPSRPGPAPTRSAWDETTRPSPTPSETSLPCPEYDEAVVGGRLFGGGLSVPVIDDARWDVNPVRSIPWAICATGLERRIVAGWVSEVILAGVQPRSMTGSLQQQADAIAADSRTRFYTGDQTSYSVVSSRATTVDGLDAWELRYQVRIDYLKNISGDNVDLLVVQHGDGSRSVLLTFATIGDGETQRQVDGCRTGVRAEKR